jgi:cytochrome P450
VAAAAPLTGKGDAMPELLTGPGAIPAAPRAWPLLGHVVPLLTAPLAFASSLPSVGDLVQIRLGPVKAVVVCDPELTRQVLTHDQVFDKGGPIYDRVRELAGDGLGTCPHSRHRRQRRLTQPAFHHTRLPAYARTMTAQIDTVTGGWRDGQDLDVLAEMQALTARVMLATMFSTSLTAEVLQQSVSDMATFVNGVSRRTVMPAWLRSLPTPGNRRYQQAIVRLRNTIASIIAGRQSRPFDGEDLLSALLAARDTDALSVPGISGAPGAGRLSRGEVYDQVMSFFLAGSETLATALAWALHLLACHPAILDRLHAEIDTVLAGRTPSWEDLPRLKLTSRIIAETLRLYPSGGLFSRTVTTDTRLGAHSLPAGTPVLVSPYLIHRRPDVYPDPGVFDPDRWPAAGEGRTRGTYLPFGAGARVCIGERFALTEAVLALAAIAARWQLDPVPGSKVRVPAIVVLRPSGLRMRVRPRLQRPARTLEESHASE